VIRGCLLTQEFRVGSGAGLIAPHSSIAILMHVIGLVCQHIITNSVLSRGLTSRLVFDCTQSKEFTCQCYVQSQAFPFQSFNYEIEL
jgi:hypothetical protein